MNDHNNEAVQCENAKSVEQNRGPLATRSACLEPPLAHSSVLVGINRILNETLDDGTEEELARVCLSVVMELTLSEFGVVGEFGADDAFKVAAIAEGFAEASQVTSASLDPDMLALCRRVLDQGSGFFTNHSAGAFLGVPLVHAGRILGVVAVGRRAPGDGSYQQENLETLNALAPTIARALDRKRAKQSLCRAQLDLAAELADTRLLQELSVALVGLGGLDQLYAKIMDAAVAIMRADCASMQMLHPERGDGGELRLLAFRGFNSTAAAFWEWVRIGSESTCGIALRTRERVIVPDVRECTFMAGSEDLAVYLQTGIRSVQSTPLLSRSGKLLGMISTHWREAHEPSARDLRLLDILARMAADLVERRQLDEAMTRNAQELASQAKLTEDATQAKSRFLAAASHDLRQPVAALTLYVDTLKSLVGARQQPLLSNMRDCIDSLSELLSNLLDVSKLDAGVVKPNVSDFRIDHILDGLLSVHVPEAHDKGLRLGCVPSKLVARTDPVLFRRMLGNLIANAIRYTNRGGVVFGCRRRNGKIWVEVWDSGIGIPAGKTEEIFEDFKQLGDDARTRGSGLGLSIVDRTAKLLGLEIRVDSRLGRGSMFALELPVGISEAPATVSSTESVQRTLRIGLVEDNEAVRLALACALESKGHRVVAAGSGAGIVEALRGVPPDVLLSDYRLADGETGTDVVARLREHFGASLPALVVTGETGPEVMRRLTSHRIDVQHKPVDLEVLHAQLIRLASNQGQDREPEGDATLSRVAGELSLADDFHAVVQIVKKAARQVAGADGACFVLNEGTTCYYVDEDAVGALWKGQRFERRTCISGWVMERCEPAVIEDVYLDSRIPLEAYRPTFVRSLLAVPIGLDNPAGALTNYWGSKHRATDEEITKLQALAALTAGALERLADAQA